MSGLTIRRYCRPAKLMVLIPFVGCSEGTAPPSQATRAISTVSGQVQTGMEGEVLSDPFVVRVVDARGAGVSGAVVTWRAQAAGAFFYRTTATGLERIGVGQASTSTDATGLAEIYFQPLERGTHTVTAGGPFLGAPMTFSVEAARSTIVHFAPSYYCGYETYFVGADTVLVGTPVEWLYDTSFPNCPARIVSTSVPSGATAFDSGIVLSGARFTVVVDVEGTWTYVDQINSGSRTLTVVAP